MKKYFNAADKTAFVLLGVSIIWILLYKFCWINDEPLFSGAGTVAGITDTVASSIIASAIFYIITIFIPRYVQIKESRKEVAVCTQTIDKRIREILDLINKDCNESYSEKDLDDTSKENELKKSFIICYQKNKKRFSTIMIVERMAMNSIFLKYKNEISSKNISLFILLKEFNGQELSKDSPFESSILNELIYDNFSQMYAINKKLKTITK
jgi:hypothetical protein